jgi:hypothetical protein
MVSAGATLGLMPASGSLTGAPGATVGWGFTIANPTAGTWIEVTSAAFCAGSSGTSTQCAPATIGTFTDYISGYGDVVVGASPDSTSVTQGFSAAGHQGIAGFLITAASGQTGTGQIVLTYNVFSRSPHDAAFNPDTDTVSTDNFLTAAASVTVVNAPPPTPAPPALWLTLTAGLCLLGERLWRRRALPTSRG